MKSYEKLRRLRDETIFQVKRAKHMLKTYQEEVETIKDEKTAFTYLNMKKAIILDELIETLGEWYEIE